MNINEYYNFVYKEIEKTIPLNNKARVNDLLPFFESPILDVGCHVGNDVFFFYKLGYDVEGCEISKTFLRDAKERHSFLNFFWHDFQAEPTKKKYSTIYAFDVIEHCFDYFSFLKNVFDSLNENGTMILTTPNPCGIKNIYWFLRQDLNFLTNKNYISSHLRFFNESNLKPLLERIGFREIQFNYGSRHSFLPRKLRGNITVIAVK